MCVDGENENVLGDHHGLQCDQISEAIGVQRAASGSVDEKEQCDHVGGTLYPRA